jgi:hypothetical protein
MSRREFLQHAAAAAKGNVKHYFVEHEGTMTQPLLVSVADSLAYLRTL